MFSFCPIFKIQCQFRRVFTDDLPFTQWLALFCYIYEIIINRIKWLYQIHKWMINSVHYFLENNNRITVNTILVYILKRTRLAPKMTTDNCHLICKQENFKWPECFPLCEDTHILLIIIHDGIKDLVVNRNRNYRV